MDFRSIKNRLTKSIRQFRRRPAVGTIGMIKSTIKPEFSDQIGKHWRFLNQRLFKPVHLDLYRPANRFGQVFRPPTGERNSHFVFSPTIRLSFNLYPINNVFFENITSNSMALPSRLLGESFALREFLTSINNVSFENNSSRFQSLRSWVGTHGSVVKRSLGAIENLLLDGKGPSVKSVPLSVAARRTISREFWSSLLRFKEQLPRFKVQHRRVGAHEEAGIVRNWERLFGAQAGKLRMKNTGGAPARSTTSFRHMIPGVAQPLTQSLTFSLTNNGPWRPNSAEARAVGGAEFGRAINGGLASFNLSLRTQVKMALTYNATSSTQAFPIQLDLSAFRSSLASQKRAFTNAAQMFVTSKQSSPESIARQLQYFGRLPDLSYARSEPPQLQAVVNALRDLRPAQSEMKSTAPQMPSIAQLTTQVRQELEREIRIEKERRGL